MEKNYNKIIEKARTRENIIIYGAGIMAGSIYECLRKQIFRLTNSKAINLPESYRF